MVLRTSDVSQRRFGRAEEAHGAESTLGPPLCAFPGKKKKNQKKTNKPMKIYDRTHGVNLRTSTGAKPSLIRTNAATAAKLALGLTLLALILLPPQASATPFAFTTGFPDGKIGTLSRPASAGLIQTETADDFVLNECVLINQATFTGLLPTGAPLSSINRVEIEIYHV